MAIDPQRASKIRGMLISFYGADPGPYEIALATVATDVFSDKNTRACFLERVDALDGVFVPFVQILALWIGNALLINCLQNRVLKRCRRGAEPCGIRGCGD
ncbi:hypothetical protein [Burkholderia pyrrocinia]